MLNIRYKFLVNVIIDANNYIATLSNYISTSYKLERT